MERAQPRVNREPDQGQGEAIPQSYLNEALQDAERLMKYAAEVGVTVDDKIRHDIVHATTASQCGWTEDSSTALLAALTTLAAQLKPVPPKA